MVANAVIHTFRSSGKWCTTARGVTDGVLYKMCHDSDSRRDRLLQLNGNKCPGLIGRGEGYIIVVIPHDDVEGFPLVLWPRGVSALDVDTFLAEKQA